MAAKTKNKSTTKKIIATILVCVLFAGIFPIISFASLHNSNNYIENKTQDNYIAIIPTEYRGYRYLQQQNNADALVFAYNKLAYGIENFEKFISIVTPFRSISYDEMLTVYYCYIYDNPQSYWVDLRSASFETVNDEVILLKINYKLGKSDVESSQKEIKAVRDDIIEKTKGFSDKEKELFVHDYLIANIDTCFGYESECANTLYGALVEGQANCLGFTHAFTFLMRELGVDCFGVYGEVSEGRHAWNVVLIEGKYYNVDVTWDTASPQDYEYFNLSDQKISETHSKIKCAYDYPVCV